MLTFAADNRFPINIGGHTRLHCFDSGDSPFQCIGEIAFSLGNFLEEALIDG